MAMAPWVQQLEALRGGGAGPAVVAPISLVGVSAVVAERLDVGLLVLAGGGQRDADVLIGALSCGVLVYAMNPTAPQARAPAALSAWWPNWAGGARPTPGEFCPAAPLRCRAACTASLHVPALSAGTCRAPARAQLAPQSNAHPADSLRIAARVLCAGRGSGLVRLDSMLSANAGRARFARPRPAWPTGPVRATPPPAPLAPAARVGRRSSALPGVTMALKAQPAFRSSGGQRVLQLPSVEGGPAHARRTHSSPGPPAEPPPTCGCAYGHQP
jgi:hypothetical protein